MYGIYVNNHGSASITNSYGLYVSAQSGSTNSYAAIFAGGNVGIGTTSPSYKLHLAGETAQYPVALGIAASGHATSRRAVLQLDSWQLVQDMSASGTKDFGIWGGTIAGWRFAINTSGNVGIGTTSPGAALDVAGTLRLNGTTAGTNYTEIKSAATPSTNVTYTLPSSAPASTGYYLTSTTSGAMSWGAPVVAPTITIGTTGTDFNGSSQSGPDTIFLNLPTASSSVRGALSSTDWTTFNSKA
ncbi:MAG: hypothetical protein EBW68_11355, partial [Actinobacteria bacterium]|nr:hypothetical protein [Actinomycetota bacterium]